MKKHLLWLMLAVALPVLAAINGPFTQQGHTLAVTTNATPNTSQSALIKLSDLAMQQVPSSIRVVNAGTVPIWVSITPNAAAAVLPTPGTTTAGVPTSGRLVLPGVPEVFGFGVTNQNIAGGPTPGVPTNTGFWVNTIATTASQLLYITPGEGQ